MHLSWEQAVRRRRETADPFCGVRTVAPAGSMRQWLANMQLFPFVLLGLSVLSAWFMYMPARTAVLGTVVCEHPEPFQYCALEGRGLFEIAFTPDRYGALCPLTPQAKTLIHPYLVRPTIQWLPLRVGREACWEVGFVRNQSPDGRLSWNADLRAASAVLRSCDRSTNDHIMVTALDEIALDGGGTLYLSVKQPTSRKPVEVIGAFIDVRAVYD